MLIKDLLSVCDSFDDFTKFICYAIKEDYCCNGFDFVELNKLQLLKLYGDSQIEKFYVYKNSHRVDLLFKDCQTT